MQQERLARSDQGSISHLDIALVGRQARNCNFAVLTVILRNGKIGKRMVSNHLLVHVYQRQIAIANGGIRNDWVSTGRSLAVSIWIAYGENTKELFFAQNGVIRQRVTARGVVYFDFDGMRTYIVPVLCQQFISHVWKNWVRSVTAATLLPGLINIL